MPVIDAVCNFLLRVVKCIGKFGDYLMDLSRQLIIRDYSEEDPLLADCIDMVVLDLVRDVSNFDEMREGFVQVSPPIDVILSPASNDYV